MTQMHINSIKDIMNKQFRQIRNTKSLKYMSTKQVRQRGNPCCIHYHPLWKGSYVVSENSRK
uniref:Uncharacterized protein n=1 Tax=Rhizophora mucronata TaxID=61149 RepID=A0A2P2PSA2_RHIMU